MQFKDSRSTMPLESTLDEMLTILRRIEAGAQPPIPPDNDDMEVGPDADQLLRVAKTAIRMREIQRKYLPASYFDEPALNILLDLYVADAEGRTVYVNDACIASNTPTSTALRWIAILVRDGFAVRTRDAIDARRTILAVTPEGHSALSGLLGRWSGV
ncbi:hypothetical protein [Sphingomonas cavernae]|uniref:MarR family transcriptional regulator n=1 Tax=Sphingomonas cavernae TaxID=2320861 RepID=A0A418WPQ6_9SPHN|nr:hypothetical protein [Sphingomonas cavernae]RJF93211.1 hypothetical protein D3876_02300 [Sphingomonas cavernae]